MARAPIYVREMTDEERTALMAGLRSRDASVLRRCQILLASASGKRASQIARAELGCDTDTALNAINAFNQTGLEALKAGSSVAHTIHRGFEAVQAEQLRALLHQSPRSFGKATSLWTLELAAEVSFEQGVTPTFNTGAPEIMEGVAGSCRVRLKGETEWKTYGAGESYNVPGNSSFDIEVSGEPYHYVCHFG